MNDLENIGWMIEAEDIVVGRNRRAELIECSNSKWQALGFPPRRTGPEGFAEAFWAACRPGIYAGRQGNL
jgi:hypothetical protein